MSISVKGLRVTKLMVDRIAKRVVSLQYDQPIKDAQATMYELAASFHAALYGEHVATMNKLPDGAIAKAGKIDIAADGMRHQIVFSHPLSIFDAHRYRTAYVTTECSPDAVIFSTQYETTRREFKRLVDEKAAKIDKLSRILASYTTVSKLVEALPDMKPFVEEEVAKRLPVSLPALVYENFKQEFGLPADIPAVSDAVVGISDAA